jgi:integrase/recombinase XerD
MNIKRAALDRTRQPETPAGDYHPDDPLIAWLQSL